MADDVPHRTRSARRAAGPGRRVLRRPDGARGRELPHQRPARARRSRHRHHPRQESRGRSQRARSAGSTPTSPTRSSRPPTRSSPARLRDQFVVDVYQAGAGTSHNMNANEVLANRAAEILGEPRGTYTRVHPNDHVNMGQSTNDVFPTATRLALLLGARRRSSTAARELADSLDAQGRRVRATCSRPAARTCRTPCRSRSARSSAATPRASRRGADDVAHASRAAARAEHRRHGGRHRAERRRRLPAAGRRATSRATPACRCSRRRTCSASRRAWATCSRTRARCGGSRSSSARSRATCGCSAWGRAPGSSEIALPAVQPGSSIMPGKVNPSVPGDGEPGLLSGDGLRHDDRDRRAKPASSS